MPRTARLFATIDVNYFEDARVLDAGDAWPVHFAAILTAKRGTADGYLTRRQLQRAAFDLVSDFDGAYEKCIRVGLFIENEGGITIRSWERWNDTQADIEKKSKGGTYANHVKWHTGQKAKPSAKCPYCTENQDGSNLDSDADPGRIEGGSLSVRLM